MADTQKSQLDYKAIARQAYEWLKKRGINRELDTSEAVLKAMGLTWKDLGDIEDPDEFLNRSGDALLSLIEKEKEYEADFSTSEGMYIGQPYVIPFIFRIKGLTKYDVDIISLIISPRGAACPLFSYCIAI